MPMPNIKELGVIALWAIPLIVIFIEIVIKPNVCEEKRKFWCPIWAIVLGAAIAVGYKFKIGWDWTDTFVVALVLGLGAMGGYDLQKIRTVITTIFSANKGV